MRSSCSAEPPAHRPMRFALAAAAVAFLSGEAQVPTRDPLPVPDLPGYHTLKGDFHLHTVFSDGEVWPTVHVREAWRDGLDVIALTDHVDYHPHEGDVTIDNRRPHAIAGPLASQLGILVIPGAEITHTMRPDDEHHEGRAVQDAVHGRSRCNISNRDHDGRSSHPDPLPAARVHRHRAVRHGAAAGSRTREASAD